MATNGSQAHVEAVDVLTVSEVAGYLRVTTKTVYGLARGGELQSFRVGRAMRFRRRDIEAFVAAQLREAGNGAGGRHVVKDGNRAGGATP